MIYNHHRVWQPNSQLKHTQSKQNHIRFAAQKPPHKDNPEHPKNNLPEETPGAKEPTWKKKSLKRRAVETAARILFIVQMALLPAKVIPFTGFNPLNISPPVQIFQQITYIPYEIISLEMTLYYLLRRKKIVLAHEMGHDLGMYRFSQKYQIQQSGNATAIKLQRFISKAERGQLIDWSELTSSVTPASDLRKMVKDTSLFAPEQTDLRKHLQGIYRDYAITIVTANMLDSYLNGRSGTPVTLGDRVRLDKVLKIIAFLERPPKGWNWKSKRDFMANEKKQIKAEAEAFLTSLDFNRVRDAHQKMLEEAKQGKKVWTIEEMNELYKEL